MHFCVKSPPALERQTEKAGLRGDGPAGGRADEPWKQGEVRQQYLRVQAADPEPLQQNLETEGVSHLDLAAVVAAEPGPRTGPESGRRPALAVGLSAAVMGVPFGARTV